MPTPQYQNYISQITLPNGTTYHIKDAEARQWIQDIIAGGLTFVVAWDGTSAPVVANIPAGAVVIYNDTSYTGTLIASASTKANIYLVHSDVTPTGRDYYEEYVTVNFGTEQDPSYAWEVLGNTDISLDVLGDLAWKDTVTLTKGVSATNVLGASTTFSAGDSAVSFTGGASDSFVKSYPGATSKLVTTTISGCGDNVTFDAVDTKQDYTATKVTFGTNTTASKVTLGSAQTANKTTLGTAGTASKASAGTAVSVATRDPSSTAISYVGDSNTSSILATATVTNEVLSFGTASVTQGTVWGTNGTESITPYSFTDVTVYPSISVSGDVSVPVVSASDVTVPVISAHEDVTTTKITTVSKTAATKDSSATTVATGSLSSTADGDSVMTGLGTPTTATAVTSIGTGTAAGQTITVGSNDTIGVAKYSDLSVSVS